MAAPTDDVKKDAKKDAKRDVKDGKAFYGYLYDKRKKPIPEPTPLHNALLRAIALHIIDAIGDKNDNNLTPSKLAAFYKSAGYNYDGLFLEMPAQSISFIYQVQACQHNLVQPGNETEAPSIPALTTKGFIRWQSIQTLLDPQTHVPIMQFAVKNWALKNPDDGTPFPADLPKESFPLETDADTDLWHQDCAIRLREQATPKEDPKPSFTEFKNGRPVPKDDPKPGFAERKVPFAHVRVDPSQRDYFSSRVNYVNPEQGIPRGVPLTRSPERDKHRDRDRDRERDRDRDRDDRFHDAYGRRHTSSSDEPPRRRRSGDRPHFPQEAHSAHLLRKIPAQNPAPRRHSQPRHYSSASDLDDSPVSPGTVRRRRSHHSTEPPHPRRPYDLDGVRVGSSHPHLPTIAVPLPPHEHGRKGSRGDDSKRGTLYDIKDKVMSFLPVGSGERQRSGSRGRKDEGIRHDKYPEPKGRNHPASKLRGSWSDYNSEESDSDNSYRRHRRPDKERDRERDRDRPRDRDTRERERDKALTRDRERPAHVKDRPRDRDRDSDERRERDRDRDRHRDRIVPDGPQRRSRDPSDEDLSPKTRTRGAGVSSHPYLVRPDDGFRRASSHADISRKRDWDVRDHDRPRDDKYRDRDRDRERERERSNRVNEARLPSPGKGVSGRVYPEFNFD